MPDKFTTAYASPLGNMRITGTALCIQEISFPKNEEIIIAAEQQLHDLPGIASQCVKELTEYFNGVRRSFEVRVDQDGTIFQQRIWKELLLIPFGKTISYFELSRRIGDVKAIRAAAATNGKNKLAIIVPCHRVIGSNGDLVGYAGGLHNKRSLLAHEARLACGVQTLF